VTMKNAVCDFIKYCNPLNVSSALPFMWNLENKCTLTDSDLPT
jgi:hypothetical protein